VSRSLTYQGLPPLSWCSMAESVQTVKALITVPRSAELYWIRGQLVLPSDQSPLRVLYPLRVFVRSRSKIASSYKSRQRLFRKESPVRRADGGSV
jgi:hypothetical protein